MAATPSKMIPLGTPAPSFELLDVITGKYIKLNDLKSSISTVIMFICNHCPYVKLINSEITKLGMEYIPRGVSIIAINSNNYISYPDDSPENMKINALEQGFPFPYLLDETQEIAKAYQAECTPDIFIYDKEMKLVYRGQFDDARPGNGKPVTGIDVRLALEAIISNLTVNQEQIPSIGCNIKWK